MSLSAGDQAQVIGVGVAGLLAFGAGLWRAASLRGDMNARWATRVQLAVAALDEKTIRQLEAVRAEVDDVLPEGEFDPTGVIADPAPLSQLAETAVNLHRSRVRMDADLARLMGIGRMAVVALVGMLVGTACATAHYGELWGWEPLRLFGLILLAGSAALLIGVAAAYVVLQDRLASAEQLAGTAGQATEN
jgi:hypothetical protein